MESELSRRVYPLVELMVDGSALFNRCEGLGSLSSRSDTSYLHEGRTNLTSSIGSLTHAFVVEVVAWVVAWVVWFLKGVAIASKRSIMSWVTTPVIGMPITYQRIMVTWGWVQM